MHALAGTLAGASVLPIAIKAVGEIHHHVLQSSNVLARQGNGSPDFSGEDERLARQRTAGVRGGFAPGKAEPGYMGKVPDRKLSGDDRKDYKVGGLGNATSSRGVIDDLLDKVPRRTHGATADYKKANRPVPSRKAGWGNQSYTP